MAEFLGVRSVYVIKSLGLVWGFPVKPRLCSRGVVRTAWKNRNNDDIVPPGWVPVKHYTTPPSRQYPLSPWVEYVLDTLPRKKTRSLDPQTY